MLPRAIATPTIPTPAHIRIDGRQQSLVDFSLPAAAVSFGLALDGSGNLWFTNNFNRSQSDPGPSTAPSTPSTGLLRGITTGDPAAGPDLANNAYDQFFEDATALADYGYNNSNWRNDAADDTIAR